MIKIPIAISKNTGRLVNVIDVPNGLECNCYCAQCEESLIAVNREIKQKAHFRHKNNSHCEFNKNFESYLHWLVKEVFKNINNVSLPPIKSTDIKNDYGLDLRKNISKYLIKNRLPDLINIPFDEIENYPILMTEYLLLQKSTKIQISSCLTEKAYQSKFGDIKVDIVVFVENKELFIEPFYTHQIDDVKLQKIADLNISTISINLLKFIEDNDYLFTIQDFTNFLIDDLSSKKWEYIRDSKVKSLINNLFTNVWPQQVENIKALIKNNEAVDAKISENNMKIDFLVKENSKLRKQIKSININDLFGI
jgi:hypothetical protein